jgi:hypothetical protein
MSLPSEERQTLGAGFDRLIDRLVDRELSDQERRELLLRLEAAPDGWRRCALAFLEAQSWREAFHPLAAPTSPAFQAQPDRTPARQGSRRRPWRPVARLAGLAAGLAAAFALGWAWGGRAMEIAPPGLVAHRESWVPEAARQPLSPPSIDVPLRESRPSRPAEQPSLLDPVVKRLEQRGYRSETQTWLLPMELNDGRKIDVPVREVRLRYVGDRTY